MRSSASPKKPLPLAPKVGPATAPKPSSGQAFAAQPYKQKMLADLRAQGIKDEQVLGALGFVDRHLFVDSGLSALAYQDEALPIGQAQTISKPSTVARMLELACQPIQPARRKKAKVLEVGTGCGYQAACMAQLFGEVYSIERLKLLSELARQNLRPFRLSNLRLLYGDGYKGIASEAPFDAIVVAAAAPSVPEALLQQLKIRGRLVIPVGQDDQVLQVIDRLGDQQFELMSLDQVRFVPMLKHHA